MFAKAFFILKWMPKVTLFYIALAILTGLGTNSVILWATFLTDMMDYVPLL